MHITNPNKKAGAGIIPAHIRYNSALNKDAKYLYAEISAQCDETGYTSLTNEELAALTGDSTRTIVRQISILKTLGFVTSKRQFQGRLLSVYTLPGDLKKSEKPTGLPPITSSNTGNYISAKNGAYGDTSAKNGAYKSAKNGAYGNDTFILVKEEEEEGKIENLKLEDISVDAQNSTPHPQSPAPAFPAGGLKSVTTNLVTEDLGPEAVVTEDLLIMYAQRSEMDRKMETKTDGVLTADTAAVLQGHAEMLKSDRFFLDSLNATRSLGAPVVEFVPKFMAHRMTLIKPVENYSEFKRHFMNWLNKQPVGAKPTTTTTPATRNTTSPSIAKAMKKKASWMDAYKDEL
jgi:hypothetical protein